MTRSTFITDQPPGEIERTLVTLGRNIRTARLRRRIKQSDIAERLGVSRSLVARVEQGNPKASIAVYLGVLWVLGLLSDMDDVANPENDVHGRTLERLRLPKRARNSRLGS